MSFRYSSGERYGSNRYGSTSDLYGGSIWGSGGPSSSIGNRGRSSSLLYLDRPSDTSSTSDLYGGSIWGSGGPSSSIGNRGRSSSLLYPYRPSDTSSSNFFLRERGFRPLYKPLFKPNRSRPRYDRSFWRERNYTPLQAESDDEDQLPEGVGKRPRTIKGIKLNADSNRTAHQTDKYGLPNLIVRRGKAFQIDVSLAGAYKADTDTIKLQMTIGDKPLQSKGTLVRFPAKKDAKEELGSIQWGARVDKVEEDGTLLHITVMPAADCIVGEYELFIEAFQADDKGNMQMKRHKSKDKVYIIFNAWCEDDQVFLQDEAERQEYVLNERGRIYVGNSRSIYGRPWNFGQMSKSVLKCAIHLLNVGYLSKTAQSNPTQVTRCISAMANSNDNDQGILEGNWSGDYSGGTSPSNWNGSVAIIEEYMLRKRSVKYGQCWVFSALCTTLCRALGIPSRSITNFESAHDHDFSMTIDTHINSTGRPLKHLDDSVWNFHVWNESFFRRPDLPPGNDGWQVYDATPQEASEGIMRCGPAPVVAIKQGDVFLSYDCKFVFAEVNGDRITWSEKALTGEMTPISVNEHSVGKSISTKAVGKNERNDVTNDYKYEEGTDEEREAVKRASLHSSRADKLRAFYSLDMENDVEFGYKGHCEQNGDISIIMSTKNVSKEFRSVKLNMYGVAKYYTGVPGEEIADKHFNVMLEAGESKEAKWLVEGPVYLTRLDEDAILGLYIMAEVNETNQIYSYEDTFSVELPELDIQTSNASPAIGEEFEVTVQYTNTLSVRMTECKLFIEAAGIMKHKKILLDQSMLAPNQSFTKVIKMTAKHPGEREVIANFYSKQIVGITGACEVEIKA